jgi:hypothetical protein
MPLLLSPWKRSRQKNDANGAEAEVAEVKRPDPATAIDRLLVVRQTEGGFAYRLYGFPDVETANGYIQQHLWLEAQQGVNAFWARHYEPYEEEGSSEAVVIIRDPHHQGIVQLYSVTGMEAARQFLRQEFQNGIDLNLVLLYWALSVDLEKPSLTIDQSPARDYLATPALDRKVHTAPREVRATPAQIRTTQQPATQAGAAEAAAVNAAAEPSRLSQMIEDVRSWPGWDGLAPRMVRAMRLDDTVYTELDRDEYATGRARLIIASAVLAAGFGVINHGILGAFWHVAFAAAAFAAYGGVLYGFGTSVAGGLKTSQTFDRLVQALGLAASPGILLVLGIIPVFGALVVIGVYVWIFLTTSRAIAEPLELDNQSAVITSAFGVLTLFAISQVLPLVLI